MALRIVKTSKKAKLYDKGLRILQREMHRLDLKSQGKKPEGKGLNPYEIASLVKMMKPLEAVIKEDPKTQNQKRALPAEALVRRAQEVLKEYERQKTQESTTQDAGTPEPHDKQGTEGST